MTSTVDGTTHEDTQGSDPSIRSILVAIDASAESSAAVDFAGVLVERLGCSVDVLTVRETHSRADMLSNRLERVLHADDEAALARARKRIEEVAGTKTDVSTHAETGSAGSVVPAFAAREGNDLILLGSRHNAAPRLTTFGSASAQIIRHTEVPVLVVPHDPPSGIGRIGIALGSTETPVPARATLRAMARVFDAGFVVLHVADDPGEPAGPWEAAKEQLASALQRDDLEVVRALDGNDLSRALHDLVQRAEVDLLCMVRGKHGALEDLLARSQTLRESFDCPVPLLILQGGTG